MSKFARRCAALMLAVVLLCMAVPAAFAAEGDTLPAGATTMGGANTTLIPDEEENCLSWLFGSGDTITMPYLNVKGQGLRRNVTLDLEDCLVGITYTELGSIGSYASDAAAQQASTPIWNTTRNTALRPTRWCTPPWIRSLPLPAAPSAGQSLRSRTRC